MRHQTTKVALIQVVSAINPLHSSRRCTSQHIGHWLSHLRYGSREGLLLGSWDRSSSEEALSTRQLYCKALVYASGGSRLARDWIAGCAALTSPHQTLLYVALQYNATEADVVQLRDHVLGQLVQRTVPSGETFDSVSGASSVEKRENVDEGDTSLAADALSKSSSEAVLEAENYLLRYSPEMRCFLYDAMTASLFHFHGDCFTMEATKQRLLGIGARHCGMTNNVMEQLWRLVELEAAIKKEKHRTLDLPWGE